jgi:S1-C subfamily serine protease
VEPRKLVVYLFSALLLVVGALGAQQQAVSIKIRAALVDSNLNVKPVPKLALALRRLDGEAGLQPISFSTGFDGMAELQVPPGRYQLSSPQGVEFQGKHYTWSLEVQAAAPALNVELSNDNAKVQAAAADAEGDRLTLLSQRMEKSVVEVWSEAGRGTGFIVDAAGLLLTDNHVVRDSNYLAVQFDAQHKVAARLLAADSTADVAVLWCALSAFPQSRAVSIAASAEKLPAVAVGEKVFTLGHPLEGKSAFTAGIVSRVEADELSSDININPGSSGGPLFNADGEVIGITSYRYQPRGGAGITGIVRIQKALPVLAEARRKMAGAQPPAATLLPVEPQDKFPAEPLEKLLDVTDFDTKPYVFDVGPFRVGILTPPFRFYEAEQDRMKAARREAKRTGTQQAENAARAEALKDAADYVPVILIWAAPKYSAWLKTRYKADFSRMKLLCGQHEIEPILRGRSTRYLKNLRGEITDRTYQGVYRYASDALSPACGQVSLEIYSEKEPGQPFTKVLDPASVERVWSDFAAYRNGHAANGGKPAKTSP